MVSISHQFTRLSNRKSKGKQLFHTFQVLVKLAFLQGTSNGCERSHRKKPLQRGDSKLQHKRPTPKDHPSTSVALPSLLSKERATSFTSLVLWRYEANAFYEFPHLCSGRLLRFTSVCCRSLFRMTLFFKRSTRVRYHLVFQKT